MSDSSLALAVLVWPARSAEIEEIESLEPLGKYQVQSMSVGEQYRLRDLIKKHGDDYQAPFLSSVCFVLCACAFHSC